MKMPIRRIISPSATVLMNTIAQQKKAQGIPVWNYAGGDPVLPNHPAILEGAMKGLKTTIVPYPPLAGLLELRRLAAEWVNCAYGCCYTFSQVLVTSGGKFALFSALHALICPGDEVVFAAPYWPSYPELVKLCGGVPKVFATHPDNQWKISVEDLKKQITDKTRVLIFNNATNPTGTLYTQEEIKRILQVAQEKDLVVISDEVYSEIVYDQNRFVSCGAFSEHQERVVIVQSFSKNFAMTGWRIGFVLGPEHLIEAMSSLQGQTTTGTPLVSQWAAIAALERADEVTSYVRDAMQERRDLLIQKLEALFGRQAPNPASSIYTFIPLQLFGDFSNDSLAFCEKILKQSNVATVPGIAFGIEGYIRMAFSETLQTLEKGLEALAQGCRS